MTDKYYSISKVVEILKEEFPDVSVSKIRFLESKGIIKPQRRDSGYRLFTDEDINLLKKVLVLQRDYFMPLKVIKEKIQSGNLPELTIEVEGKTAESMKIDEVMKRFGVNHEFFDELEKFGLIQPLITPEGKMLSRDDVKIVELAVNFRAFGLEPRHLRVIENLASKETLSFEQILFPLIRQKTEEGIENARKTKDTLLDLSTKLHKTLIVKYLKQKFPEIFDRD